MKQFFRKISKFTIYYFLFCVLILIPLFFFSIKKNCIPAPIFSDSYSFNEKVLFLKDDTYDAKIISIGSSMTLTNLHSEVIISEFQSEKYINTASWGSCMEDNYSLLNLFYGIYPVDVLIIVSNIGDFQEVTKDIDVAFVKDYLTGKIGDVIGIYFRNFNLSYYIDNYIYAKRYRNRNNAYQSLRYDRFGMVKFERLNFKISQKRWVNDYLGNFNKELDYSYLDSISDHCVRNNIDFYFFQGPIREGLESKVAQFERDLVDSHIARIDSILTNDNHHFVNSTKVVWPDSLFVDGIHLNELGARLFTGYCFDELREFEQ